MLNRSGHIGTIALVFGALFLVGAALYSFYGFGENANSNRVHLRQISSQTVGGEIAVKLLVKDLVNNAITSSKEAVDFRIAFENKIKELAQAQRGQPTFGNVFSSIADGKYSLDIIEANYVLNVNDLFYEISVAKNEAVNRFNLRIVFNKNGVVSIE